MNKAIFFLLGFVIGMNSKNKIDLDESSVILLKVLLVFAGVYIILGSIITFLDARKKQLKLKIKTRRGW